MSAARLRTSCEPSRKTEIGIAAVMFGILSRTCRHPARLTMEAMRGRMSSADRLKSSSAAKPLG